MKKLPMQETPLGDGTVRQRVRLETKPCADSGVESDFYRRELLRSIADVPELLNCGYSPFQRLNIFHNGACWVAEAIAVVERERGVSVVEATASSPPPPITRDDED